MPNLDRFLKVQKYSYGSAKAELINERKTTHWMWYIFPQIKGLGFSYESHYYGIDDIKEAQEYFSHPLLGKRLIELCNILMNTKEDDPYIIFSHPDDYKLRSSMTLFYIATKEKIFKDVLDKFFDGDIDLKTIQLLEK